MSDAIATPTPSPETISIPVTLLAEIYQPIGLLTTELMLARTIEGAKIDPETITESLQVQRKIVDLYRPRAEDAAMVTGRGPCFADSVCSSLRKLADLRPNWDGYGSPVIRTDIIEAACGFIRSLPGHLTAIPRVAPMSTGTAQLEWEHARRALELEFEDTETIRYLQWGVGREGLFPVSNVAEAARLIEWVTEGAGSSRPG